MQEHDPERPDIRGDSQPVDVEGLPESVTGSSAVPAPPPPPPPAASVPGGASAIAKTGDERKGSLANAIQTQVAGGARIESQSDFQAVLIRGHRVNHLLHFVIGVVTIGLWWIVWIFMAALGGEKRQMVSVDEFGNVLVQKI